jgi:hypothetical protein
MRHIHSVIALALAQHIGVAAEITEYDRRSSNADDTRIVGYRIRLTGEPGNWNMNGECGAITFAKAAVWRDGKMIFNKSLSSCEDYRTCIGSRQAITL